MICIKIYFYLKLTYKTRVKMETSGINGNIKYQDWKTQNGLDVRSDIDEQTIRNIYEAIDEADR